MRALNDCTIRVITYNFLLKRCSLSIGFAWPNLDLVKIEDWTDYCFSASQSKILFRRASSFMIFVANYPMKISTYQIYY